MKKRAYFVYITTNPNRTTLYIGVTNSLARRMVEHYFNRGQPKTFAGRYYCYNLIYYERYQYAWHAIDREKQIKKWNRAKKEELINAGNPDWRLLNADIIDWPPPGTIEDYR